MPRFRTFSIRMTEEEHRTINLKAQARGMDIGPYMRFKAMAPDLASDANVIAAYHLLKKVMEGES